MLWLGCKKWRIAITLIAKKSKNSLALKRLRILRSIHEKPKALRTRLGLKRRKLSGSQKLLSLFVR